MLSSRRHDRSRDDGVDRCCADFRRPHSRVLSPSAHPGRIVTPCLPRRLDAHSICTRICMTECLITSRRLQFHPSCAGISPVLARVHQHCAIQRMLRTLVGSKNRIAKQGFSPIELRVGLSYISVPSGRLRRLSRSKCAAHSQTGMAPSTWSGRNRCSESAHRDSVANADCHFVHLRSGPTDCPQSGRFSKGVESETIRWLSALNGSGRSSTWRRRSNSDCVIRSLWSMARSGRLRVGLRH